MPDISTLAVETLECGCEYVMGGYVEPVQSDPRVMAFAVVAQLDHLCSQHAAEAIEPC